MVGSGSEQKYDSCHSLKGYYTVKHSMLMPLSDAVNGIVHTFYECFLYFQLAGHIDLINIMKPLLPASMRVKRVVPAPLTLRMLAESAKAGHWLYE
ncbi:DUF1493 family protein [Cronobacter turicensis]